MSKPGASADFWLWSSQSRAKKVLPGDDFCFLKQGNLPKGLFVDSLLHWLIWDGGQLKDKMQIILVEFPDQLLKLGTPNEKVFELKLWRREALSWNQQQSRGAHWPDPVDYRNYRVKDKCWRCPISFADFEHVRRWPFILWVLALEISKKQNPLWFGTALLSPEVYIHTLWENY